MKPDTVPQLKPMAWRPAGDAVTIIHDPREAIELSDDGGAVSALLTLLSDGTRDLTQLHESILETHPTVTAEEVAGAVGALDELRLLEPVESAPSVHDVDGRHVSNAAFFSTFSTLDLSTDEMLGRLGSARVLVLGVGGLGSNVLQNLAGLGIGHLTLVDRDLVEPRNFARQFVYRRSDIGRPKVERAAEWVRDFDPDIDVETVVADITSADDVVALIDRAAPDLVVSGVDSPPGTIDRWVNAACVRRRVPYVRGGMSVTEGVIWSVVPGLTACYVCGRDTTAKSEDALQRETWDQMHRAAVPRVNRGIGPVATLLGGMVSMEVTRLLLGWTPPAYAGGLAVIDLRDGCRLDVSSGAPNPECEVCGRTGDSA